MGLAVNKKALQTERYDGKFNIKEVSYLLNIMENIDHNGKMLEQALSCMLKLKDSLDKLTKHTE
jgi:hypothetical protein